MSGGYLPGVGSAPLRVWCNPSLTPERWGRGRGKGRGKGGLRGFPSELPGIDFATLSVMWNSTVLFSLHGVVCFRLSMFVFVRVMRVSCEEVEPVLSIEFLVFLAALTD